MLSRDEPLFSLHWRRTVDFQRAISQAARVPYLLNKKKKKISHGLSVDGLHEHSSLSDKVILEKSASLLENLVTEVVIHMLMPQYIKMTMAQRKEKTHLI